jgi:Tfp pilus assembly protein PilV
MMTRLRCHLIPAPGSAHRGACGNQRYGGFTLIEALLASLILAIGVVVICGITQRCLRDNQRGMEYEVAQRLLDECLDTVVVRGVGEYRSKGPVSGDFGTRHPGYRYQVELTPAGTSGLYRVTATINWGTADQPAKAQATTLLYDGQPGGAGWREDQ